MPSNAASPQSTYIVDAGALGVDLNFGTDSAASYQALDGSRVRISHRFPNLVAVRQNEQDSFVFGNNVPLGNTVYITVTNPLDEIIASGSTTPGTGWEGPQSYVLDFPGFSLTPGDLIHMDFGSGYTDTLLVELVDAQADLNADLITGNAPPNGWMNAWISDATGNQINIDQFQASPGGDYTLDLGAYGWDIRNGDEFHVYYQAWHGHQLEYGLRVPAPNLTVGVWNTNAAASPGGPYAFGVYYDNHGNLPADDVQIVFTLPPSTTWAGDSSGFTPEIGAGGLVTYNLGTLPPDSRQIFYLTVLLDPAFPTGDQALSPLCALISTGTFGDNDPGDNSGCTGNAPVQIDEVEIQVDKWPSPGDVVAGQEFDYDIQYCNNRSTAAGPVWMTDTLPEYTNFIYLEPRNWWEKYLNDAVVNGDQVSVYFPSIPGNTCMDLNLRLQVDPDAPFNSVLTNQVEIAAAGDVYTDNNYRVNTDARVSTPRPDLNLGKYFNSGMLVPGGVLEYKLDYYNNGNITLNGRITDTLPAGTAYMAGSAFDFDGNPAAPVLVDGGQVVWDVGEIAVNRGFGFTYRLSILDTVAPGTALLNCAVIGHSEPESSPWNNTACDERLVNDHGPNLEISKYHQWYGDGWLHYEVNFRNLGDEGIAAPVITDTYPLSTTFNGWGHNYWDWINFNEDPANRSLTWQLAELPAGSASNLWFEAPLTNPGQRGVTYTNQVEISTPAGETYPADNSYTDVAFSGGEIDRVEMNLGTDHANLWGSAQAGSNVSVLNRGSTYTVFADPDCGGCWSIDDIGPLWPGDTFTVTAGAGLLPVVIQIPAPFTAEADSRTNQVTGQIGVPSGSYLRVENYGYGIGMDAFVDDSGYYTATFFDIPRGGEGHVRYETNIAFAQVVFHRRFASPDLVISANYGHDWVNGRYEPGHAITTTLRESDNLTVKATSHLVTDYIPWWNGTSGFQTDNEWMPSRPDILAGDWVYAELDDGYTTTLQLGVITGVVDPENDRITGTVLAPWITEPVNIQCHTWGSPEQCPQPV